MLKNRSVPADVVLPHITYHNVADALVWLTKAFGFTEHHRYGESGGRVGGAQMHLGDAWIMLNSARPGCASPAQIGHQTQSLTVFVEDVDAHFERARSAGAKIVEDLHETDRSALCPRGIPVEESVIADYPGSTPQCLLMASAADSC